MRAVESAGQVGEPTEVIGHILTVKVLVKQHVHERIGMARRFSGLPTRKAAHEVFVQIVEREAFSQPGAVPVDGVVVVWRQRASFFDCPARGGADVVPRAPGEHGRVLRVARHDRANITLDVGALVQVVNPNLYRQRSYVTDSNDPRPSNLRSVSRAPTASAEHAKPQAA